LTGNHTATMLMILTCQVMFHTAILEKSLCLMWNIAKVLFFIIHIPKKLIPVE